MRKLKRSVFLGTCAAALVLLLGPLARSAAPLFAPLRFLDPTGVVESSSASPGALDLSGPFFADLGSNGRTCASCHQASDGFSITPSHLQLRFERSSGTDPVFRPNDGSVCPAADVSTLEARRQAYRLLLDRGLIRVSMPIPEGADFYLERVDDPYHCATPSDISLYRRPLPSTNLRFLTTIMWDGREPGLESQAIDATTGHAQGAVPGHDDVQAIVHFENSLHTAQAVDGSAGALNSRGATGGPGGLARQVFYPGINDTLGADPTGAPFNPTVFNLFDPWKNSSDPHRASVARGQEIFNHRPIEITGVKGLNDALNIPVINGTCSTCHNSPNVGNHSLPLPIDIGSSSFDPSGTQLSYLPKYVFRCDNGEEVVTTDPGRAMVTGRCSDLGKLKGPILRGLAARAPYFHNGRARDLGEAVDFYDQRFSLGLTPRERADLIAFLRSL